MSGITAFREAFMASDTLSSADFSTFSARQMRYQIFWAFYESTAYRDVHKWAPMFKSSYGLYRHIRNIYNPSFRLAEFWRSHLLAGALDPDAGDGKSIQSALPIITENDRMRPALAALWKASNWQKSKDILSLRGTILGDSFIRVNDDPAKGRVYLTLTHPGTIYDMTTDDWGNIKGYIIRENWADPNGSNRTVVYEEHAYRDGVNVVYDLYLDGKPYNIHENEAGKLVNWWTVPYGFIPMVAVQHNDVGQQFGFSELQSALPKIREADDLASKLDDQIRKLVDAPMLFSGVKKPATDPKASPKTPATSSSTQEEREADRQDIPIFYGDVNAKAQAIVADMPIQEASEHILSILKDIERDYPELTLDVREAGGDISGRAIRLHRTPVEDRVLERRPNYDDAIVRAQQMAIAIGGFRGYPGYQGFNLESYAKGDLEHKIGDRPVFRPDPSDKIDDEKAFWETAKIAVKDVGDPLAVFMLQNGRSQEEIDKIMNSPEYKAKIAALENVARANQEPDTNPDNQPDKNAALDRQNAKNQPNPDDNPEMTNGKKPA